MPNLSVSATGILQPARQLESPNQNARPPQCSIDLLVIHGISLPAGKFGGTCIDELFTNCLDPAQDPSFSELCHLKVSTHLLIRRDGELVQYVPFLRRAWHAGESSFQCRECCNDFSIGIELEGTDETPYDDAQYDALGEVAALLMQTYPGITPQTTVGHCDIAPERKTDPGPAFDWPRLRATIAQHRLD
ncbi:MAG TPA: 1,6-anhydro-N-acetylmuramyl-L-alanine amidase AmpD [Chromatiaceae bacterium]|nr:1,6-anhydro-N-acetylmuramyl-L-alanine amidase AmpD [Chromatiaceae bacterium]HIB83487.1 1,6-anhydro-N-acetylmuramyl-L-alanine amidase AmpD [Chromatiaceae bacterium]HIN81475.1 1,6-anhydro-N-acetylmuramyl-L-alanine amidase AmpD [Chromatiales bacterium]HIO54195.1 1,6-anhydro-N-acetylmuramyl-L-alanine amidase AmpD [Chromatiales bacterium]